MTTIANTSYYQLIVENTADVIWVLNLSTQKIAYISPSLYQLLGIRPDEIINHSMERILTPESYALVSLDFKSRIELFEKGEVSVKSKKYELDQVHQNGTIVFTEVVTTLIAGCNNKVTDILCNSRDITERRNYLEQLQATNDGLELALSDKSLILERSFESQRIARIGNWEWDIKTTKVWWSSEVYRIFELDPETYIPSFEANAKFVHPADQEQYFKDVSDSFKSGNMLDIDFRLVTPTGKNKHCNLTGKVYYDKHGSPSRYAGTFMDITEKKVAQANILELERRFRYMMNGVCLLSLILDENGNVTFCNDYLLRVTGYERTELIGKNWFEISIPSEINNETKKEYDAVMNGADIQVSYENEILTKAGNKLIISWNNALLRSVNSTIIGIASIGENITERKNAEERLRISEERLRFSLEGANDGVWDINLDTNEFYISPRGCEILGYLPEEIPGIAKTWIDLVCPDDLPEANAKLKDYLEGKSQIFQMEQRLKTKSGNWKWILSRGKITGASSTNIPNRMTGTHSDISQRKIYENKLVENQTVLEQQNKEYLSLNEELSKSNLRIQKIDLTIKYILAETSLKNGNAYFNSLVLALSKTLGADYTFIGILEEDLQNVKTIASCYQEQLMPDMIYSLSGTPCGNILHKTTCSYVKDVTLLFPKDNLIRGKEIEGYIGVPLFLSTGAPFGIIVCLFKEPIKDETFLTSVIQLFSDRAVNEYERLTVQELLVKARDKAEESDRLKTVFLQNMSHEIRTPMNAIMGFSDLLTDNFDNKAKLGTFSSIIKQRCSDLLELINEILDLSKIETGQLPINKEECNVAELFNDLHLFFINHSEKIGKTQIELQIVNESSTQEMLILTDKGKLKQIFINLIYNAYKFTEHGKIKFGCLADENKNLLFFVSDTGIGIPEDKQKVIYDRFMQLNTNDTNANGGTGLGLSIVKGLVELLGGEINLMSAIGEGSNFSFSIPYQIVDSKVDMFVKSQILPVTQWQAYTLLIVEDDVYNTKYLVEILAGTGITILTAINAEKSIEIVNSGQLIDIILMDIRMPKMNGYEATMIIKKENPRVKIIAQTAFATNNDYQNAIEAGCDGYISKPINKDLLIRIISEQLN